MNYGCVWYPEQWPEGSWDGDLDLMRETGMNTLRVGEFAWSRFEPEEGRYEFGWLDRAIARAAAHGMVCVIATPTAGPPAWLTSRYPEVLRIQADGRTLGHGIRQHVSPTHPTFLELCRKLASAMAEHFGNHPAVIGWQIDNEFSDLSYDPLTRRLFQEFCRQRYGTLAALNEHWTTAYWSQEYAAWDQIPLARQSQNAALLATLEAFITRVWQQFFDTQAAAIRAHLRRSQFVTHNFSYEFAKQDPHDLARSMEFPGVDTYVFTGHLNTDRMGFYLATTRGLKRGPFWVMETQPGFVNYMPVNTALDPGETRRMVWHQVGHGADGVLFWQWRTPLAGQEQLHGTILGTDGKPRLVYTDIARVGRELAEAAALLRETQVEAPVALAWSYRDRACIETCRFHHQYDIWQLWCDHYGALRRLGIDVDAIRADMGLSGYRLVVAPQMAMLDAALAASCRAYVEAGGHLLLGPRTGIYDEHGALLPSRPPGTLLCDLIGACSEEYFSLAGPIPVEGKIAKGSASVWAERLRVDDAAVEVLLRYGAGHGWLTDQPALVSRPVGAGRISLLGACLDRAALLDVMEWACRVSHVIMPWGRLPDGLEISRRTNADRSVWVVINHGPESRQLPLPPGDIRAVDGKALTGALTIAGNDVTMLVRHGRMP